MTENRMVNVVSEPCNVVLANSGMTTEKLKANVPTMAIMTNGTHRSGIERA